MAFLTGLLLLDAPAAALNNSGQDTGQQTQNAVATKFIRTPRGQLPYVSAQAFRYWLRGTLERDRSLGWQAAPVFREQKIAYTDSNPIRYWDDDLFGYMRAQSRRADAVARREADAARAAETPTSTEITRISPFRVSSLLSIAPVQVVQDFGTMARQDGDAVPHEHQFYHAVLRGLLSLDLRAVGTFSYRDRTGFRNLDDHRRAEAVERDLEHLEPEGAYRLPPGDRAQRVAALLQGLATVYGGAKQALHYTDVTPVVVLLLATRGGNNPLQYVIRADSRGEPEVNVDALEEVVRVWGDQMLSPFYAGWVTGFHDEQRERLATALQKLADRSAATRLPHGFVLDHPRGVLGQVATTLQSEAGNHWMD